jgi:hypothetical protein
LCGPSGLVGCHPAGDVLVGLDHRLDDAPSLEDALLVASADADVHEQLGLLEPRLDVVRRGREGPVRGLECGVALVGWRFAGHHRHAGGDHPAEEQDRLQGLLDRFLGVEADELGQDLRVSLRQTGKTEIAVGVKQPLRGRTGNPTATRRIHTPPGRF